MGPLGLFGQSLGPGLRALTHRRDVEQLIGVAYTVPGGQIAEARFGHNEFGGHRLNSRGACWRGYRADREPRRRQRSASQPWLETVGARGGFSATPPA
jgi:hypothetical protein